MKYNIETYSNKGPRKNNQDRFITEFMEIGFVIAAIADGVGGKKHGDLAAEKAVELYLDLIHNSKNRSLSNILLHIHNKVFEEGIKNKDLKGMLTTLSGCVIGPDKLWFGHIGDTRIYVINSEKIERITEDHSEVFQLIKEGKLSKEDAELYPRRNVLTAAIGMDTIPEIQSGNYPLKVGDCVLMTTDGVHGVIDDNSIFKLFLNSSTLAEFKKRLIRAVNLGPPTDNNSFICIQASPSS